MVLSPLYLAVLCRTLLCFVPGEFEQLSHLYAASPSRLDYTQERKPGGFASTPYALSATLQRVTGCAECSRPQVRWHVAAERSSARCLAKPRCVSRTPIPPPPPPLLRFQVVKKIWEYIKLRDLQNPVNKSEIHCDGDLKAVMGGEATVTAFSLNKYIGAHLTKMEKAS